MPRSRVGLGHRLDGAATPAAPASAEVVFWQSIKDGDDKAAFEAYLQQFPGGAFARLARLRIRELAPAPARPPSFLGTWVGVGTQLTGES